MPGRRVIRASGHETTSSVEYVQSTKHRVEHVQHHSRSHSASHGRVVRK